MELISGSGPTKSQITSAAILMTEITAGKNWSRIRSKPAGQQRKHDEWMEQSPEPRDQNTGGSSWRYQEREQ